MCSSDLFETNTAEYGGGLYAGATVTLDHVEATGNVATDGAGVYLIDTTLDADELLLSGNIADAGGGIYADGSSLTVVHARVLANTAGNGNGGGIELAASVVDVQASLFAGNVASSGGAFHVGDGSAATLSNLTITENGSSGSAGGVRVTHEGALTMLNTVIAWSTEGPGLSGKDGATLSVRYGDLWANVGGAVDSETADPTGTDGNLAVDPLFVAFTADGLGDDDLHLAPGSPLIDAGDPTLLDGDGSPSDIGAYGGPFGTTWDDGEDDTGDGDSGDRDTGDGGAKDGGCHCGNPGGSWLGGVWIGLLVTRRRRR